MSVELQRVRPCPQKCEVCGLGTVQQAHDSKAQLLGERGVDRSFQNKKLGLVFALQVVITFSF